MKKFILSAAIALASVSLTHINAQVSTSIGVKLDGNLTNVKMSSAKNSSSFKPGASLGGFVKIDLTENFALQPELSFSYTESKIKTGEDKIKYKYASVEVPVYALGQFAYGSGKFFIGAGPHIGYGFSVDSRTEKLPEGHPGENKTELDHWYMGGGILAGYEFANKISIRGGCQMGFDLSSSSKSGSIKTQTFSLGLGYRF